METSKAHKVREEDDPLYIPNPNLDCYLCRMMWKYWKLLLNTTNAKLIKFKFPDDPVKFKSWCGRIRNVFNVSDDMTGKQICSLHFEAKDFIDKKTLTPNAVPFVRNYVHYFEAETAPRKSKACLPDDTCFLCHMLKNWKVELEPRKEPVKLFQIPEKGDAWRLAIRQVFTNKQVHEATKICGMHFKDSDFVDDTRQQLKNDAVPVVHKYSHYFNVIEKLPNRKTVPNLEVDEINPEGGEKKCLLCTLLSKWKIKLKKPSVAVKLFPIPKGATGSAWKAAIQAVHLDKHITNDTVICSLHFRQSDFVDRTQQKLKLSAVPIVHKYGFYFSIAIPKYKKLLKGSKVVCIVCSFLKEWEIKLKPPANQFVKLFALPQGDKHWTAAIRKVHPTADIDETTMICSLHFRNSDFIDDTRQILQPSAVPIVLPQSFYTKKKMDRLQCEAAPSPNPSKEVAEPPKRKMPPLPNHALKRVRGGKSKSGSDCEDYIEIDWMKF